MSAVGNSQAICPPLSELNSRPMPAAPLKFAPPPPPGPPLDDPVIRLRPL